MNKAGMAASVSADWSPPTFLLLRSNTFTGQQTEYTEMKGWDLTGGYLLVLLVNNLKSICQSS
jgi:hypothetical protein